MNQQRFFAVALVVVCGLCCLGFGPCSTPTPTPTPEGGVAIGQKFIAEYRAELSRAFDDASRLVAAGSIKTDVELLEYLQTATENARKQASIALDEYLEAELPDGELKRADAKVLRDLASGLGGK